MSSRKQSRRRRTYGRRQHEVRERRGRREPWSLDVMGTDGGTLGNSVDVEGHAGEWLEGGA